MATTTITKSQINKAVMMLQEGRLFKETTDSLLWEAANRELKKQSEKAEPSLPATPEKTGTATTEGRPSDTPPVKKEKKSVAQKIKDAVFEEVDDTAEDGDSAPVSAEIPGG